MDIDQKCLDTFLEIFKHAKKEVQCRNGPSVLRLTSQTSQK